MVKTIKGKAYFIFTVHNTNATRLVQDINSMEIKKESTSLVLSHRFGGGEGD